MCGSCGCSTPEDELSKVELIKASSNLLRGDIAGELASAEPQFSESSMQLLKFHGIYQQEDRDRRKDARRLGLAKHHQLMVRTRIPGGIVSPDAYLAHDRIAAEWGNATMRVTTRQDFQLHGVLKGDVRAAIREINQALLTTLGGCGDVERNIMCCPAPVVDGFRAEVAHWLAALVAELTPATRAYHEIWLDGELAVESVDTEAEPLYGPRYLPRKFKTAIALSGDNCVDVHANDLGLVALRGEAGSLSGFTALVGGGLGRTRNKPDTFAAVAQPLATVLPHQVVALSRAVIEVQRDHGNRAERRHARLKYLIAERGLPWFAEQVQSRVGFALGKPSPITWPRVEDHLGWHEQGDDRLYLGIFVENGRIADTAGLRLRSALREVVETIRPQVRLTAQQNVILADVSREHRSTVSPGILEECGARTRLVDVGKRGGGLRTSQDDITAQLIEAARAGLEVVRLKGGDPFVFGRGGEELDALRSAGIATHVVPGVTSALAAPAAADIPVTFRGVSGSVAIVTGRDSDGRLPRDLEAIAAAVDTLVVLMPLAVLPRVAQRLTPVLGPEWPAAVIAGATTRAQTTVRAPLRDIAAAVATARIAAPATLVLGRVVDCIREENLAAAPDHDRIGHHLIGEPR